MNENMTEEKRKNPFFEPYNTPHDTVPFDKIKLEDFEEAFMEGIRRDNEQIEKTVNNPEKPTFDNTIINADDDIMTFCHACRMSFQIFSVPRQMTVWTPLHRRCNPY